MLFPPSYGIRYSNMAFNFRDIREPMDNFESRT
jgi:hypothetical protein